MNKVDVLERLKDGVRLFQANVYAEKAEEYRRVATTPQRPHTLVIACADSRVNVESITGSGPGDVFVTRNIGNMVPAFGEEVSGVGAVIEYAVTALKVRHIVVCGHSDCGAIKALLDPASADAMPTVKSWLSHGATESVVSDGLVEPDAKPADGPGERMRRLTEQNVLLQLAHLHTHPSVAGAIRREELTVSGWVYEIGSGEVRIAEEGQGAFLPVSAAGLPADSQ